MTNLESSCVDVSFGGFRVVMRAAAQPRQEHHSAPLSFPLLQKTKKSLRDFHLVVAISECIHAWEKDKDTEKAVVRV
jgi:hypothetical protein